MTPGQAAYEAQTVTAGVLVNGEPVGDTAGSQVRWEDTPNRHAYCDSQIRLLRDERDRLLGEITRLKEDGVTARAVMAETIAGYDAATASDRTPEDHAQLDEWNAALAKLRERAGLDAP